MPENTIDPERIDPLEAAARIRAVSRRVDAGRRGHAAVTCGVALVLVAYFALLGSVHRGRGDDFAQLILVGAPTVCVLLGQELWRRWPGVGARRLDLLENRVLTSSAVLTMVAGVLAVKLAHPVPSTLTGILPAAPWLLLSWRTVRA